MRAWLSTAALLMATGTPAAEIALRPVVESGLRDAIERGNVRSVVVGLYRDGDTVVIGLGQVSATDERKPDADTVFEIGSVTKVFTALLAQTQVEAGRAEWDDTVGDHLSDAEFESDAVAAITLRELASHTSGLPRIPDNMAMADPLNPYAGYEDDDLLEFLTAMQADTLTKQYDYSNLGAGLLGHVAAAIAGKSYADAMQRDVLAPLGLDDTAVGLQAAHRDRLAVGYSQGADMPNWSAFDALAGAGALVSTVSNMLEFIRVNLEPDHPPASLLALRDPQGEGDTGLGWHIHDIADDDPVYWHNGGSGGYASFLAMRPQHDSGVVILTASTEYSAITELGFVQIGVSDTDRTTVAPRADEMDVPRPRETIAIEPGELEDYVGRYRLTDDIVITVLARDAQLFAQLTGQQAFPVFACEADRFFYKVVDAELRFERNEQGAVIAVVLHQNGEQRAPRIE